MRFLRTSLAILAFTTSVHSAEIIVDALSPEQEGVREAAFLPWVSPKESSARWKQLSKDHIPIYFDYKLEPQLETNGEQKDVPRIREIYIKNPGVGYWVLAGLSEEEFLKTQREKLKIKDALISATTYVNEKGERQYWALWAPASQATLLTKPMADLGISQAQIVFSPWERLMEHLTEKPPVPAYVLWASVVLNILLILFIPILFLGLATRTRAPGLVVPPPSHLP